MKDRKHTNADARVSMHNEFISVLGDDYYTKVRDLGITDMASGRLYLDKLEQLQCLLSQ